ncbi:MAG: chemoreceptor glutamine deamidase CheD [Nitrospira sp. BO4]|jgi:chemotaxis protein CheD|nr:chemoreceptor glutamine deamidase CheD [Nitrospira sp. BO4]
MSQPEADQFSHIRRMRDRRFPHEIASILPGEFFVSREPMVVYTVLGSCISACIRDPIVRVGGMNHFMLPEPKENAHDSWGESTRYGSFAMESLINEILKRGGIKSRLEIKLFGAGRIYDGHIDVGDKNAKWVIQYLKSEGLTVLKTDLGDVFPRKVYYFTESGRVLLKKIERIKNRTIFERENEYATRIQQREQQPAEDVTLF